MLATYEIGAGDGPPLLIAHGLFGSARNWGAIAKRLSSNRRVVTVDMRNHGASPWIGQHRYEDLAADLATVIGDDRWDVLGHSMGGKAAMALALLEPERVGKLIVADIAPVTYEHTQLPMIDAMHSVNLDPVKTRSDADRQLAETVAEPAVRAFLLQSLDLKAKAWRLNTTTLAAEMDHIIGWPNLPGQFEGPTYFVSGGASNYVAPAHRPDIRRLFPKARFAKIPGAGHWLHAEKPREFEAMVQAILA